jgi:hypothetical protein
MAISKDGNFLAINNSIKSSIRVWDLNTRQEIREYKLCQNIKLDGVPSYTKFSELNTDLIYFSGRFPQPYSTQSFYGILVYSILENKIIDTTFASGNNRVHEGYFSFFENEEKIMYSSSGSAKIYILDLFNRNIVKQIQTGAGEPGAWIKLVNKNFTFLGFAGSYFSMGKYDSTLGVVGEEQYLQTLFPNPTNGIVTLDVNCQNPNHSYEINDITGVILIPNTVITTQQGIISIDLSVLPTGTYFLRYHCGSSFTTYKVIKEN